MTSMFFLQI